MCSYPQLSDSEQQKLTSLFSKLTHYYADALNPWWPHDSQFEVIVGAFLTQNTVWKNVAKAIQALKREKLLSIKALAKPINTSKIRQCVRPTGYFRQKTKYLQEFCIYLLNENYHTVDDLFKAPPVPLRHLLLNRRGIGPETADAILLFAAGHPQFVVDTYTIRILQRYGYITAKTYDITQHICSQVSPKNSLYYQQIHGAFVEHAKKFCKRTNPKCNQCPIRHTCNTSISNLNTHTIA